MVERYDALLTTRCIYLVLCVGLLNRRTHVLSVAISSSIQEVILHLCHNRTTDYAISRDVSR